MCIGSLPSLSDANKKDSWLGTNGASSRFCRFVRVCSEAIAMGIGARRGSADQPNFSENGFGRTQIS
jgi:hypothetical protein